MEKITVEVSHISLNLPLEPPLKCSCGIVLQMFRRGRWFNEIVLAKREKGKGDRLYATSVEEIKKTDLKIQPDHDVIVIYPGTKRYGFLHYGKCGDKSGSTNIGEWPDLFNPSK